MVETILVMNGICKSFGGTKALQGINFELRRGEVHALLGENGAGKSTLIKILGGIHGPDQGSISINGSEEKINSVSEAHRHGIGIIHQEIVLVPDLTVAENIFLGREPVRLGLFRDKKRIFSEAEHMVADIGLALDVRAKVKDLTIAQQQLVEIVKAISFDVKILVMDEPTSSLTEEEVRKLFSTILHLRSAGVSIIYISHRMEEIFEISDRVTVLRDGKYIGTKETCNTDSEELIEMMVGRGIDNYYMRNHQAQNEVVLQVEGLTRKGAFQDVSFSVRRGEVVGFSGLIGAGRSEIMLSIFGADGFDGGKILLNGKNVRFKNPRQAISSGVALVPENRKLQGLTLIGSVGFNIVLAAIQRITTGGFLSSRKRAHLVEKYISELNIKTPSESTAAFSLSGGNQQKTVLAKWLATTPELLILDEPTRGVDIGAKHEIYGIIDRLAREGIAIILVSSEMPEIINLCDTVYVVRNGGITGRLSGSDINQVNIMRLALGEVV